MRKRTAFALVCLLIGGSAVGARALHARSQTAPVTAPTTAVETRGIRLEVREVGTVEPFRKAELKSKVPGQVARVRVDVGERVKAGDVLVELDPVDKTRDLTLARARQDATEAQLQHAQEMLRLKEAALEHKALSLLDVTSARGDVARLKAQLAVDKAEVDLRRDQVGYTQLRSPLEGVVLERNVQPGEMVTPGVNAMVDGKPLLVVAQVDRVLVRTELSQLDVVHISVGQAVEVRIDALPGVTLAGQVYRISANGKRSERHKDASLLVFPVDVVVDRSQAAAERVAPGMLADLRIGQGRTRETSAVPLEAVVRKGDKTFVRAAPIGANAEGELKEVVLGVQDESHVEILSGAPVGERVSMPSPAAAPVTP